MYRCYLSKGPGRRKLFPAGSMQSLDRYESHQEGHSTHKLWWPQKWKAKSIGLYVSIILSWQSQVDILDKSPLHWILHIPAMNETICSQIHVSRLCALLKGLGVGSNQKPSLHKVTVVAITKSGNSLIFQIKINWKKWINIVSLFFKCRFWFELKLNNTFSHGLLMYLKSK